MKGETLRSYRKKRGLSQTQVGDRMGVTKATVSQMELQDRVWPETALRYLQAVEAHADNDTVAVQIDVFVGGELVLSEVVE